MSTESVISRLKNTQCNKASGPFDPPLRIVKCSANLLGPVLTYIINFSFTEKRFAHLWKTYDICLVPKVSSPPSVQDLRPIAVTSIFSKILESYTLEWMIQDVLPSITPAQYGGLSNSSTIMALINLLHHWFQALEKPKTAISLIFGLYKSFRFNKS